jgi:rubrerythrin
MKMSDKKFFRCNVCSDIHYGIAGSGICPTCQNKNAYVEIEKKEARFVMGL